MLAWDFEVLMFILLKECSWKSEPLGMYLNQFNYPLTARGNAFVLFFTSAVGHTTGWWQDLWTHSTLHFTGSLTALFLPAIEQFQFAVATKSQGYAGPSNEEPGNT